MQSLLKKMLKRAFTCTLKPFQKKSIDSSKLFKPYKCYIHPFEKVIEKCRCSWSFRPPAWTTPFVTSIGRSVVQNRNNRITTTKKTTTHCKSRPLNDYWLRASERECVCDREGELEIARGNLSEWRKLARCKLLWRVAYRDTNGNEEKCAAIYVALLFVWCCF